MRKRILIGSVITAFILIVGGVLFVNLKSTAVDTTSKMLVKEVVRRSANDSISQEQIDEIANTIQDSMQDDDKKVVEDIIENHLDGETIQDAMGYISNNDIDGLKEYANEKLTEEEKNKLNDLYNEHKTEIDNALKNLENSAQVSTSSTDTSNVNDSHNAVQTVPSQVENPSSEGNNLNEQYNIALSMLNSMSPEQIQGLIQNYNAMSNEEKQNFANQYGMSVEEIDLLIALYS